MSLARNPWVLGAACALSGAGASLLVSRLVFERDTWAVGVIPLLGGFMVGFVFARRRNRNDGH